MTNADILAIGQQALERCRQAHGGQHGYDVIRQAGEAALACLDAARGMSGAEVIRRNGEAALRRLQEARGGLTPGEKVTMACRHGRLISGEVLAKAMTAEPPSDPGVPELDKLLPDLAPPPSLDALAGMVRASPLVQKALAGQEIRHQRQQAEAARLAEVRRIASQKPRRPIAPYADLSGRISGADVADFADAVRRARKAGFDLHTPRQVVAHGVAHWGLSHETGAMLTYALADRLQAARDGAAA